MNARDKANSAMDELYADGARFVLRVLLNNVKLTYAGTIPHKMSEDELQQIRALRARLHPDAPAHTRNADDAV